MIVQSLSNCINDHGVGRQACCSKGIPLLTFRIIDRAEMRNIPSVIAQSSRNWYSLATMKIMIEENVTVLKKQVSCLSIQITMTKTRPFDTA